MVHGLEQLANINAEAIARDRADEAAQLRVALAESLKLQSHYAELLNTHDGGARIRFANPREWIDRLRQTGKLPPA